MPYLKQLIDKNEEQAVLVYEDKLNKIRKILKIAEKCNENDPKLKYFNYFKHLARMIIQFTDFEKILCETYFQANDFDQLLAENKEFFEEIDLENYPNSYLDPAYSAKLLGEGIGQVLSYVYMICRGMNKGVFCHQKFSLLPKIQLALSVYDYILENEPTFEGLKVQVRDYEKRDQTETRTIMMLQNYGKDYRFYKDIIDQSNTDDLRFLFRYGCRITENEIKTAQFFAEYPEEKLKKLSKTMANAYINSFIRRSKEVGDRKTVKIIFNVGQERLLRHLVKELGEKGFHVAIGNVNSTPVNPQYRYDHRFDFSLFMDEEFASLFEKQFRTAVNNSRDILSDYSGMYMFMKFGEKPFDFENKIECLKFSEKQQEILRKHQNEIMVIIDDYLSMKEATQSCIAFPTPEIGENFQKIFEDTFEINMLDTDAYEEIQQKLIDVLDEGEYVHVKGNKKNKTDIHVQLHSISNRDEETNFINCGCDINIPVGEVFTSPVLKGTNGILHIDDIFLWGRKYKKLKLKFKDGFVEESSCENYESEEENRKYLDETLFFPHKTLPLGEFAIGTNTHAYVMAHKYDIMSILPILIVEKMGPHFAIGDTCFFRSEEGIIYNRYTNKTFIATDNEKSILRKTDAGNAYTYTHTDITVPYEDIDFITMVRSDGSRIDLIKDGRFVLPGTEVLNKPLDNYFGGIK